MVEGIIFLSSWSENVFAYPYSDPNAEVYVTYPVVSRSFNKSIGDAKTCYLKSMELNKEIRKHNLILYCVINDVDYDELNHKEVGHVHNLQSSLENMTDMMIWRSSDLFELP